MRRLLLRGSLRGRLSCWLALQAMLGLGVVCVAAYVVIAMTLASLAAEVVEFHEAALWEVSMCAEVQGDASASVERVDLSKLPRLLAAPSLQLAGTLTGEAQVTGTPKRPEVRVNAQLTQGSVRGFDQLDVGLHASSRTEHKDVVPAEAGEDIGAACAGQHIGRRRSIDLSHGVPSVRANRACGRPELDSR